MIRIPHESLKRFMRDVLAAYGVPPADAEVVSDVLIMADLQGIDSHGVSRLGYYGERLKAGVTKPTTQFEVVKETPSTAVIDGHDGMGHVIGTRAMQLAIDKARSNGLGAVAVRNSTHYGFAGYYPLMAIREEMIGLATSNARPCIAPTHGVQPMFGTNPLAFGAPTDEECPFLFDAGMSVTQRGKIEILKREGKPVPDGWSIDETGEPQPDAEKLLDDFMAGRASLLPLGGVGELLGGHKGFGISIILEILSSALQSGRFLEELGGGDREGRWEPYRLGHFFLAIKIDSFVAIDEFKRTTGEIVRRLRASTPAPGKDRIWTAGEKEWEAMERRAKTGIPITSNLQDELRALARDLGLAKSQLPF